MNSDPLPFCVCKFPNQCGPEVSYKCGYCHTCLRDLPPQGEKCCGEWTGKEAYDCNKNGARIKPSMCACLCHKESSVKRYIRGGSNIEYASGPQLDFSQESSVKEVPYSERDHTHCADQKQPPACGRNPHPTSCCLCGKETPVEGWEREFEETDPASGGEGI